MEHMRMAIDVRKIRRGRVRMLTTGSNILTSLHTNYKIYKCLLNLNSLAISKKNEPC